MYLLLTGGTGMLGSAIKDELKGAGFKFLAPTRREIDLCDFEKLRIYMSKNGFDAVIHCAALVGGIKANLDNSADFLLKNLQIDSSILRASVDAGIETFLYMSSSCAYPLDSRQPFKEADYKYGSFEPTNEGYAKAKLVAVEAIRAINKQYNLKYRSLVLSNLYGPRDNFSPYNSHLIAASLVKCHEAVRSNSNSVEIWGSGNPRREFTFVKDVAKWITSHVGEVNTFPEIMNLGSAQDHSISEYYEFAAEVTGFKGVFAYNNKMPDGIFRKLLDSTIARESFGWKPSTRIKSGMQLTYDWWLANGGGN